MFKDSDGNDYTSNMTVDLASSVPLSAPSDEGLPWYIVLVISVSAILVGLVIYRSWTND